MDVLVIFEDVGGRVRDLSGKLLFRDDREVLLDASSGLESIPTDFIYSIDKI